MLRFFVVATHVLSWCCRKCVYNAAWQAQHSFEGYNLFFAATLGDLVQQWFEYAGLAMCRQRLNKLRSCAVEPLLAHWVACLKQLEKPVRHRRRHHP